MTLRRLLVALLLAALAPTRASGRAWDITVLPSRATLGGVLKIGTRMSLARSGDRSQHFSGVFLGRIKDPLKSVNEYVVLEASGKRLHYLPAAQLRLWSQGQPYAPERVSPFVDINRQRTAPKHGGTCATNSLRYVTMYLYQEQHLGRTAAGEGSGVDAAKFATLAEKLATQAGRKALYSTAYRRRTADTLAQQIAGAPAFFEENGIPHLVLDLKLADRSTELSGRMKSIFAAHQSSGRPAIIEYGVSSERGGRDTTLEVVRHGDGEPQTARVSVNPFRPARTENGKTEIAGSHSVLSVGSVPVRGRGQPKAVVVHDTSKKGGKVAFWSESDVDHLFFPRTSVALEKNVIVLVDPTPEVRKRARTLLSARVYRKDVKDHMGELFLAHFEDPEYVRYLLGEKAFRPKAYERIARLFRKFHSELPIKQPLFFGPRITIAELNEKNRSEIAARILLEGQRIPRAYQVLLLKSLMHPGSGFIYLIERVLDQLPAPRRRRLISALLASYEGQAMVGRHIWLLARHFEADPALFALVARGLPWLPFDLLPTDKSPARETDKALSRIKPWRIRLAAAFLRERMSDLDQVTREHQHIGFIFETSRLDPEAAQHHEHRDVIHGARHFAQEFIDKARAAHSGRDLRALIELTAGDASNVHELMQ